MRGLQKGTRFQKLLNRTRRSVPWGEWVTEGGEGFLWLRRIILQECCRCQIPTRRGRRKEENPHSTAVFSFLPDTQKACRLRAVYTGSHSSGNSSSVYKIMSSLVLLGISASSALKRRTEQDLNYDLWLIKGLVNWVRMSKQKMFKEAESQERKGASRSCLCLRLQLPDWLGCCPAVALAVFVGPSLWPSPAPVTTLQRLLLAPD